MWAQNGNSQRNEQVPFMNTLTTCVNKVVTDGYTECFKVTAKGLYSTSKSRYYRPEQVQIINFFRFEGASDPADNAIMYVIETSDGLKGTLIDAYGTYSDGGVSKFMAEVEDIRKKVSRHDQNIC